MNTTTQHETTIGTLTAYEPRLSERPHQFDSPEFCQCVALPEEGVTINGVAYVGHTYISLMHSGRAWVNIGSVHRKDGAWAAGEVTDSARDKIAKAVESTGLLQEAERLVRDPAWRRAQVTDIIRSDARSQRDIALHNARMIAYYAGEDLDHEAIVTEVLASPESDDA